MPERPENNQIKELGATLLEVAMTLMASGASTSRIRNTINRISIPFNCTPHMLISQRTIMLSIYGEGDEFVFSSLKRTPLHGVNFNLITGISQMSWLVIEEKWNVKQISEELHRLCAQPHYSRITILLLTALAGASFCRLATGSAVDMAVVFVATTAGLFIRQEATRLKFNPYACIYFASLTASLIAGALVKFDPLTKHEFAFATSVLFLIPGVPLINAFSDMIEGNLQNGLIRGLHGFIISFAIALGLSTSMAIYQF